MGNACTRKFKKGEKVYVVDYWGTNNGSQAFEAEAQILKVDEESENFTAVLYGDTYQTYSFEDYGRLIFDDVVTAAKKANELPSPKSTIYHVIGKRVYIKVVEGIDGQYTDETYDLVVCLNKGKNVSTKEIGRSLFTDKTEARNAINSKK